MRKIGRPFLSSLTVLLLVFGTRAAVRGAWLGAALYFGCTAVVFVGVFLHARFQRDTRTGHQSTALQ